MPNSSQSGRGDCEQISYSNYDLVKTFPNVFANNSFWPDPRICNKTGEVINVNISGDENLASLEVPGSWGPFTKRDFSLAPNQCGEISHSRKSLDKLSKYHLTISDGSGNVKIEQDYQDRPTYPVFDNSSHKFSFANSLNHDNWELLFKPSHLIRSSQKSAMGFDYMKLTVVNKQDQDLVSDYSDWSSWGELQYSLRIPRDVAGQIESNVLNLFVAPLGFNFKRDVDKILSGLVYNNFKKVSSTSKQLSEVDGTGFDISKYPNLALCKVYAPSYTINDSEPMGSTFTNVEVTPLGDIYSSNETLVNNLDYAQTMNTMSFSWLISDTTTYTLVNAWSIGTKISYSAKAKANFPIAGADVTYGFQVDVSYDGSTTSSSSHTDTKTINFPSQAIIVNPHSKVIYRGIAQKAKVSGNLNIQFPFNDLKVYGLFARDGNCTNASYKNLKDLEINTIKLFSDPKAESSPLLTFDTEKQLIYATDVLKLDLDASYNTHLEVAPAIKLNNTKSLQNSQMQLPNLVPFWNKVKSVFK